MDESRQKALKTVRETSVEVARPNTAAFAEKGTTDTKEYCDQEQVYQHIQRIPKGAGNAPKEAPTDSLTLLTQAVQ